MEHASGTAAVEGGGRRNGRFGVRQPFPQAPLQAAGELGPLGGAGQQQAGGKVRQDPGEDPGAEAQAVFGEPVGFHGILRAPQR